MTGVNAEPLHAGSVGLPCVARDEDEVVDADLDELERQGELDGIKGAERSVLGEQPSYRRVQTVEVDADHPQDSGLAAVSIEAGDQVDVAGDSSCPLCPTDGSDELERCQARQQAEAGALEELLSERCMSDFVW